MTESKIKEIADRNGWTVECFSPLELSIEIGDRVTGQMAEMLLMAQENDPQYVVGGYNRFFRKCQVEGWDKSNYFLTVTKQSLSKFVVLLAKALAGEKLPATGEDGSTYDEFGADITITVQSAADDEVLVFPCHKTTLEWLTKQPIADQSLDESQVKELLNRMWNWKMESAYRVASTIKGLSPKILAKIETLMKEFGNCGWQEGTIYDKLRDGNDEIANLLGYVWVDEKDNWVRK